MNNKQKEWEYLPIWKALYPIMGTYLRLAFKYKDPFFFSNVNPAIETSGLFGESKIKILNSIPDEYKPITVFLEGSLSLEACLVRIKKQNLNFPLVAKPNIGERGFLVKVIKSEKELEEYLQSYGIDIIVQEFVDLPREMAVMYYRIPGQSKGYINSVCIKRFLSVIGDGNSSVLELMLQDERAARQINRFEKEKKELLKLIPKNGEHLVIEKVGNHSKGTTFLDGSHLLNEKMLHQFNLIGQQMNDIFYGRFDLKYNTLEELCAGINLKIIEFNGVGAEPAHIYDTEIPIKQKMKSYKEHLIQIGKLHEIQKSRGVKTNSLLQMIRFFRHYNAKTKLSLLTKRKSVVHDSLVIH